MNGMTQETAPSWSAAGARLLLLPIEGLSAGDSLSEKEAAVHAAFRMEKRRAEWLAGRLAAKTLLSRELGRPPRDCEIGIDRLGRPCCGETLVSISHSSGWALAAMKPGCAFLGVDLEKIEERHPAWYRDYFHPSELPAPDPSEATRLWAVKEALLKALGLGLMADPLDIRACARISLKGKALKRYQELGSPAYDVEARPRPGGFWTAVAACRDLQPPEKVK